MSIEIFEDLQKKIDIDMKKCINIFQLNIRKIYIGRISNDILSGIRVEYYKSLVPIYQLGNIIVENSKTLLIVVFDKKTIKLIEKAILKSDLGLIPILFDNTIRLTLPTLTEERRQNLIRLVRIEVEKSKISIRNIRDRRAHV